MTVGSYTKKTSRVVVFDRAGGSIAAASDELSIATVQGGGFDIDCAAANPNAPVVAADGTTYVTSEIDTRIFALDPSLHVMAGWPYTPATPLVRPGSCDPDGLCCLVNAIPAVGPDDVLYLPLQAAGATAGGTLVAVGRDGRVRPGWPVELRRPGAEFWSVVVGSDGTAYALAVEPEAGDTSSASILAIAPDSTVLYRTTIIEP